MKVFITGASGFLGGAVMRRLLVDGHSVVCLVRAASDTDAFRDAAQAVEHADRLHVVHGDLQRIDAIGPAMRECDVVVHAAAAMTGGGAVLFLNNVVATRRLVAAIQQSPPKRLVLVSSLGVYGVADLKRGTTLDETCAIDPEPHRRDLYSYSKVAQERACWEAHAKGDIALVVVRPGVIYGPGRGVLSARIGLRFGNVMIKMGGQQRLPYTYVDNCAAAIVAAAVTAGIEGQEFNVVDDNPPAARHVLKQYRRQVEKLRVIPIPGWLIGTLSTWCERYNRWSKGQLPAVLTPYKSAAQWKPLAFSNAKSKAMLNWRPAVTFENGLQRTYSWCQEKTAAGY